MKKYDEPEAVFIRWADSCNLFQDRWAAMDDLDIHDEEVYCTTLGWLVAENDHSIYIAGSTTPSEIGSVMQIPKSVIKHRATVWGIDGKTERESPEGTSEVEVRWP